MPPQVVVGVLGLKVALGCRVSPLKEPRYDQRRAKKDPPIRRSNRERREMRQLGECREVQENC